MQVKKEGPAPILDWKAAPWLWLWPIWPWDPGAGRSSFAGLSLATPRDSSDPPTLR